MPDLSVDDAAAALGFSTTLSDTMLQPMLDAENMPVEDDADPAGEEMVQEEPAQEASPEPEMDVEEPVEEEPDTSLDDFKDELKKDLDEFKKGMEDSHKKEMGDIKKMLKDALK